jgi:hypothetical protein
LAGGLAAGVLALLTAVTSAGFRWPWKFPYGNLCAEVVAATATRAAAEEAIAEPPEKILIHRFDNYSSAGAAVCNRRAFRCNDQRVP